MAKKSDGVIWFNNGWYSITTGFCPTKDGFRRLKKRLGIKRGKGLDFYPKGNQMCTSKMTCRKTGTPVIIVTASDEIKETTSPLGIAGICAHEAVHVWQYIKEHIGEESPGMEQEAYAIQAITHQLFEAFEKTRGTIFLKKAGRATHELKA